MSLCSFFGFSFFVCSLFVYSKQNFYIYNFTFSIYNFFFTFHFSLFTFHFSLFTFHFSLFTFHFSLFTFHFSLLIIRYSFIRLFVYSFIRNKTFTFIILHLAFIISFHFTCNSSGLLKFGVYVSNNALSAFSFGCNSVSLDAGNSSAILKYGVIVPSKKRSAITGCT
ncbi:hypothetical protein IMCC3317_22440 [Kordia antarctica]|uniref:Uncharacterized protein n=1 Tax=Kordia antarctica TaxID=1218801 RepID=A0A7L4ZLP2_9FLAO|nr:hypothetical protein IMCC3317_22440 [Kordia antarctica]